MAFKGNPEHKKVLWEAIEKKDIQIWNNFNSKLLKKDDLTDYKGFILEKISQGCISEKDYIVAFQEGYISEDEFIEYISDDEYSQDLLNLYIANQKEVNLEIGADLAGIDLIGVNLSNADLRYADLGYADLEGAGMRDADLEMTVLERANLNGVDLRGANLDRANLVKAILELANLEGATLVGADLRGANLIKAILKNVTLADIKGNSAKFTNVIMKDIDFTKKEAKNAVGGFLEIATAEGLETVDFGNPNFLIQYLEDAFEYAHREDIEEKKKYPDFVSAAIKKIKLLLQLFKSEQNPPQELIQVVQTITAELIKYLKAHPKALYTLEPRQFEELIAGILSSYGWQVRLF